MPNSIIALKILQHFGPMATTSVNISNQEPLNDLNEIKNLFGDLIDIYITDKEEICRGLTEEGAAVLAWLHEENKEENLSSSSYAVENIEEVYLFQTSLHTLQVFFKKLHNLIPLSLMADFILTAFRTRAISSRRVFSQMDVITVQDTRQLPQQAFLME